MCVYIIHIAVMDVMSTEANFRTEKSGLGDAAPAVRVSAPGAEAVLRLDDRRAARVVLDWRAFAVRRPSPAPRPVRTAAEAVSLLSSKKEQLRSDRALVASEKSNLVFGDWLTSSWVFVSIYFNCCKDNFGIHPNSRAMITGTGCLVLALTVSGYTFIRPFEYYPDVAATTSFSTPKVVLKSDGVNPRLVFQIIRIGILTDPVADGLYQVEDDTREQTTHDNIVNFTEELVSATSFARQLSDQMTLAKAYVILAKEHNNLFLAWELSSQIRNCQLLLSKAAMRGMPIMVHEAEPVIQKLSSLIYKAQDAHYDISTTIMTMKTHIQALEERASAATAQSVAFGQFAAAAVPRNLHCLNIKLTVEWLIRPALKELAEEQRNSLRLVDNNLYHFCIFSDNVLATSAVVNSTISNADHPTQLVFHIVTDSINYRAMQAWFLTNNFKGSIIEVQNVEDFSWLNASYSPVMKLLQDADTREYYLGASDPKSEVNFWNPKYISLLNHLRFYIPELYPSLEKVVFLDDDVIVQKDLTPLFSLELHGNVNGAVETCLEAFHRFYKYLNFSSPIINLKFDPQSCGWAFGMNVFDLVAWKKANVTAWYHYWQEQNVDRLLWKTGTLPPGLLSFYGLTEPLDRRWHVLGLGYDSSIDDRLIESGAVVHYNGNMKPWLKLAIGRYKPLWDRLDCCIGFHLSQESDALKRRNVLFFLSVSFFAMTLFQESNRPAFGDYKEVAAGKFICPFGLSYKTTAVQLQKMIITKLH
ncbi:Hexosyltransferase gaut11 [Asimina triloba]